MAKKKKKSKIKKLLKTLGKVAALGGAAYGASKLFGGTGRAAADVDSGRGGDSASANVRASKVLNDKLGIGYKTDPILHGGVGVKPSRLNYNTVKIPRHSPQMQWGSGLKKGGRVTGIAKRGFGRALMKGKK